MQITEVNRLPAITWRHLKINDTTIESVPEMISEENIPCPYFPAGITLTSQKAAFRHVQTGMGQNAEEYVSAQANQTQYLIVNGKVKEPVFFAYTLQENLPSLADDYEITAEENSEVTFLFDYNAADAEPAFHAGTTKVIARAGSLVRLLYVETLNGDSLAWDNLGIEVEENSRVEVVQILLGGSRILSGVKTRLLGGNSQFDLKTVYFGSKNQNIDLNFAVDHIGCDTLTDIKVEGALTDSAVKTLRSTISFESGAKRSVGHESEDVLLFSPNARNRTVPLILCTEEDVEGQHAASVGRIDADKLFYLQTRGLSEADAKKLLLEAKFAAALEQIPNEGIRKRVREYLERSVEANADAL